VEHQQADVRQVSGRVASADDTERFLRELRELRDGAGLGHAELAARAHYPYDSIKAAEVGPALPDLPVLSAFVRACGGTTEEWEERWRSLTRTPSLPVSEARSAGNSEAAAAGARIGSVSQADGNPDPSMILAALNRVAEGMASASEVTPSPSDDVSSWPDFPPDGAADGPTDGPTSFEPDVFEPGLAAVSQPDVPNSFAPDVPNSFEPDVPNSFAPDVPNSFEPDVPAVSFPPPAAANEPAAGGLPPGWDPIRVSTAWPAIPDSLIDATLSGEEAPPWESAPRAQGRSKATPLAPGAVPDGWDWVKGPGTAQTAGSKRRAAPRAGAAGRSRTWIVVAAVVLLLCVLGVVLALFA
jgi:Helix-turn-helix domain